MHFGESKELLSKLAENMKNQFVGANRWKFISDLLDDHPEDVKMHLKVHFDSLLLKMKTNDASDIDLGGPG